MAEFRQTVLVVDDDLLLCRSLVRNLSQRGFDVVVAHEAGQGLEIAQSKPLDLILLDWILPDRDGVALLRELRDAGVTVPVIMLTAETSVAAKVRAFDQGADDYLVKPFAIDELLARVDARMRRRSGMVSSLRVGRVAIDTWKQLATVDGKLVDLSPLEFALLSILIRNAGQIVSHSRIIAAVWHEKRVDGNAKALHIVMTRLRRKLGDAADQIETVRGAGFRFTNHHSATG